MPGYLLKHELIDVEGVSALNIRSLLDRQQYADPLGRAEALGISSAAWPLFGLVWPSGVFLAEAMVRRPVLARERILELGCGLALASLVSHWRGADVTASDCHPLAGEFLLENLRLNDLLPMTYCHGDWSEPQDAVRSADTGTGPGTGSHLSPKVSGLFDLIIGSDVLYERDEVGVLPDFIGRHGSADGEVIIIDPNRSNRSPFHRRMAAMGYALTETPIRAPLAARAAYSGRMLHYRRGRSAGSALPFPTTSTGGPAWPKKN